MPKHIFFDLDNTLMMSRTEMIPAHRDLFKQLCDTHDVIVVSGAQESQIRNQIPESIGASYFVLSQTGNHAVHKDSSIMWSESFTENQTQKTLALIEKIKSEMNLDVKDPNDLIEQRGSQISYSPIGHHETLEKKYAFDPGAVMRKKILAAHATDVAALRASGVDVVPGGTTCFDFFLEGKNKGYNVARLITQEGWNKEDSMYVGDALFPGGNDETVIGVIPTHAVKGPDETFEYIASILA